MLAAVTLIFANTMLLLVSTWLIVEMVAVWTCLNLLVFLLVTLTRLLGMQKLHIIFLKLGPLWESGATTIGPFINWIRLRTIADFIYL